MAQKNIEYTNTTKINLKSWLSNINNEVLINTINIPGSHDSAASNVALSYKSQCQNYTIYDQLNFGIRYLDARLSDKDSNIFLCHGPITCYKNNGGKYLYKDLLNECSKFLNENPSEFIIINVKNEQMASNIQNFNKKVDDETLTIVNAQNLYISNEIPKLKDVRGKIILNKSFLLMTLLLVI